MNSEKEQRIVINVCFGGFGLSNIAYEKLIELGIPCRAYKKQKQDPNTGLWLPEPKNEGEVIFDRHLIEDPDDIDKSMENLSGRYWNDG